MKLKLIVGVVGAALAVTAIVVSGAGANTPTPQQPNGHPGTPTQQELAEHPGEMFVTQCFGTSEEQNLNMTDALQEQLEAEGKCKAQWEPEPPASDAQPHEVATPTVEPDGTTFYTLKKVNAQGEIVGPGQFDPEATASK